MPVREGEGGPPADVLPILPLVGTVVFPDRVVPVAVTDRAVAGVVRRVLGSARTVLLLAVRPGRAPDSGDPADPPFYRVGTLGTVVERRELPGGALRVGLRTGPRVRVRAFLREPGRWLARVEPFRTEGADDPRVPALKRVVLRLYRELLAAAPEVAGEAELAGVEVVEPERLADLVASSLTVPAEHKQRVLEEPHVARRLECAAELIGAERQLREVAARVEQRVRRELDRAQREFWLREQLRAIRQELGEAEEDELESLRRAVEAAGLPDAAREQARRELGRLERTPPHAPEYHVIRSYLDWLLGMPWSRESPPSLDLARARAILDRDHHDLEEVKERILDHLAVLELNPATQAPILCFVGPPGVGKTSLGRSIAEALGRRFTRLSLGGIRDEAEIRGHRRTYVGALPGRILQAIRAVGVRNPVFMLDEIDKLGQDFRGDPTSALLEVLDPAQNHSFSDHYLEVPFDLSRVLFIATGNTLASVPPALRDRLEVLPLSGYTPRQKLEIARRFLLPRQRAEAGLGPGELCVTPAALRRLIHEYTREAGVRELERQLGRLARKVARLRVEGGSAGRVRVTARNLAAFAGRPRYDRELAGREDEVGVATTLAYTPAGGEILFVEAVRMPGQGRIRLTGHLGEVLKESARAAWSYVRAHAAALGIADGGFERADVHVHVPAGATPKDGPSAGVALAVALASLFGGRPVRHDVAMTGEITLRGRVLPVGAVKEKVMAAAQAGIRTVLLPRRNQADLEDLAPEVRAQVEIVWIDRVEEAALHALVGGRPAAEPGPVPEPGKR